MENTANTFMSLEPNEKIVYANPSTRKKRFAKIRKKIEGTK